MVVTCIICASAPDAVSPDTSEYSSIYDDLRVSLPITTRAPRSPPNQPPRNLPVLYACSAVSATPALPRKPSVPKYLPVFIPPRSALRLNLLPLAPYAEVERLQIARKRRARGNVCARAERYGRDYVAITAYKTAVAHLRFRLDFSVVVGEYDAAAYIHLRAHLRIAYIGVVRRLAAVAEGGIFYFHEVADAAAPPDLRPAAQVRIRPHGRIFAHLGADYRARADSRARADERIFDMRKGQDMRARAYMRLSRNYARPVQHGAAPELCRAADDNAPLRRNAEFFERAAGIIFPARFKEHKIHTILLTYAEGARKVNASRA